LGAAAATTLLLEEDVEEVEVFSAAAATTLLEEDVEEVEVFGVARAIGTRLFPAARLPESETEPRITPERMFFGLLVIDDAGRAGRRGADESILASLRSRERGRKLWFGNPSERL